MFRTRWSQSLGQKFSQANRRLGRREKANRFQPRLELLENRTLLSCTVFARGDTLFIRGDDTDNAVSVTATSASVRVICDDSRALRFDGIRRIVADLGGGADVFEAKVTYPPVATRSDSAAIRLFVQGGDGDDEISAKMGVDPEPFMSNLLFEVNANGGAGNDTVAAHAFVLPATEVGFNPQPEPPIVCIGMNLNGGIGDDEVNAVMGIEPQPFLPNVVAEVNVAGGAGDDGLSVLADVNAVMGVEPQPFAPNIITRVNVDGGTGDDGISVLAEVNAVMGIEPEPFRPNIVTELNINGGGGHDGISMLADINAVMGIQPEPFRPSFIIAVNVDGGTGDDDISVLSDINAVMGVDPEPFLLAAVNIVGGAGSDTLNAVFGGDARSGSANLRVALFGGDGDDRFTLLWDEEVWNALAFVDGGAGFDTGVFSLGVRHVRVERVG